MCVGGRVNMYVVGILYFETPKVEVDYSEYLGPDWKMTFEGYGSVISNHQSFVDILVHQHMRMPCHVAKEGTKKLPFVGPIT